MKYRIKITTFKNGRKEYKSQVKMFLGWAGIDYDGEAYCNCRYASVSHSKEKALKRIGLHFYGNTKEQTIKFEYILIACPMK